MDDASQQADSPAFRSGAQPHPAPTAPAAQTRGLSHERNPDTHDEPLPALSLHLAVPPGLTLTWRVSADSTLRVYGATVWITRAGSPYDHWLNPGETLRLARGERIWLSTEADVPARVTLTSPWRPPLATLRKVLERLAWRPAR